MTTRDVAGARGVLVARGQRAAAEVEALRESRSERESRGRTWSSRRSPRAPGPPPIVPPKGAAALGTDIGSPLSGLLEGDALRAVILLSDGDWNEGGAPSDVAMDYRLAGVPIFTGCVGSPTRLPDISLSPVDPPAFAIVNRPIDLPVAIDSAMPRDTSTTITLSDESGVIESQPHPRAGPAHDGRQARVPSDGSRQGHPDR